MLFMVEDCAMVLGGILLYLLLIIRSCGVIFWNSRSAIRSIGRSLCTSFTLLLVIGRISTDVILNLSNLILV